MKQAAFGTLMSALSLPQPLGDADLDLRSATGGVADAGGVAAAAEYDQTVSQFARDLVFFAVSHHAPSRFKRQRIAGQTDLSALSLVTCHRLLDLNVPEKRMVISLGPLNVDCAHCETIPLTINLSFFETHHLLEMREWEASPDLVVHVANYCSVPAPLMPGVPKVLEDLTSIGHVAGLAADAYADDSDHMAVLKHFLQHGVVEGPPWKLTSTGRVAIAAGND